MPRPVKSDFPLMKWCFYLLFFTFGSLGALGVNRWRGPVPDKDAVRKSPSAIQRRLSPALAAEAGWKDLMARARNESLSDLKTLQKRGVPAFSGPLDYVEWQLSIRREIGRKANGGEISELLAPKNTGVKSKPSIQIMDFSGFLCWELGHQDPENALAHQTWNDMRSAILSAWAERDGTAALKAASENYQGLDRATNLVAVLSVMARSDPSAAIRLAAGYQLENEDLADGVLREMAANSPHQALSFLLQPGNGLSPAQTSELITETVAAVTAESGDPPWETLNTLADHPEFAAATGKSLGQWAAAESALPSEALTIFEKLPPEAWEDSLAAGLGVALYRSDPALADKVLSRLPEAAAQRAVEAAVDGAINCHGWENAPNAALAQSIASRLPYERQYELLDSWLRYGNFSASGGEAWIASVTDPYWHDKLSEKFAVEFEKSDPAAAVRLAENIRNMEGREAAMSSALSAWRARDPAAAQSWKAALSDRLSKQGE